MEAIGIFKKMENVTKEKPAAAFTHWIVKDRLKSFPTGHFEDEIRKIDSRDNG